MGINPKLKTSAIVIWTVLVSLLCTAVLAANQTTPRPATERIAASSPINERTTITLGMFVAAIGATVGFMKFLGNEKTKIVNAVRQELHEHREHIDLRFNDQERRIRRWMRRLRSEFQAGDA